MDSQRLRGGDGGDGQRILVLGRENDGDDCKLEF